MSLQPGMKSFVFVQQQLYIPRAAEVFCWSPRGLSAQLLTALRDWAHRQNYRTLIFAVAPETAKILTAEAESDGYTHQTYALKL